MSVDFRQFWQFDVKGTGCVGLELSVILTQTLERIDVSDL